MLLMNVRERKLNLALEVKKIYMLSMKYIYFSYVHLNHTEYPTVCTISLAFAVCQSISYSYVRMNEVSYFSDI